jgi:hypothetical protein
MTIYKRHHFITFVRISFEKKLTTKMISQIFITFVAVAVHSDIDQGSLFDIHSMYSFSNFLEFHERTHDNDKDYEL